MTRKQAIINDSSAAASPARATQPKTARIKSAKHTRGAAQEAVQARVQATPSSETDPVMEGAAIESFIAAGPVVVEEPMNVAVREDGAARRSIEDEREEIARLAYSYWEARGRLGGDPLEDWVRAESLHRQRYSL